MAEYLLQMLIGPSIPISRFALCNGEKIVYYTTSGGSFANRTVQRSIKKNSILSKAGVSGFCSLKM